MVVSRSVGIRAKNSATLIQNRTNPTAERTATPTTRAIKLKKSRIGTAAPQTWKRRNNCSGQQGIDDFYGPLAGELEDRLKVAGAQLTANVLYANHGLGAEDEVIVRDWLQERTA